MTTTAETIREDEKAALTDVLLSSRPRKIMSGKTRATPSAKMVNCIVACRFPHPDFC
jgi:hypothetical protein